METRKNTEILQPLFWEYRWESVIQHLNSPLVIARVLEMGSPEQVRLFLQMVGEQVIRDFLHTRGQKLLSARSYNFWNLYYAKQDTT